MDDLHFLDSFFDEQPGTPIAAGAPSETAALDAYSQVITSVVQRVAPSVANLRVYRKLRGGRRIEGGGSGVAITPDGYVVTSAHVVQGNDGGLASFVDGREFEFEIVGADPLSDLAVLRTKGELIAAELGDASALRVGQLVVAMGNPLGFGGSVTAGIVSALNRSFATRLANVTRFVENVIQTDAALHPGNSGGALVNGSGHVVGINTALVGPGMGQGLGLAVPINDITRKIISALIMDGRVRRAFLGIAGGPRPLPPRIANDMGRDRGIEVVHVVPDGPADHAGVRVEDILLEIKGHPVEGMDDMQRLMDADVIGRKVEVLIYRDGKTLELTVVPSELRG